MDELKCFPLLHRWRRRARNTEFRNAATGELLGRWPHPWLICDRCGAGRWAKWWINRRVSATDLGEWEGP